VVLSGDAPWVQVYTGERIGRRGLAVEPMTCPPDAFNSDPDGVSLAPGETRTLRLTIAARD
jgi:aldose 1-epimerase